MLDYVHASRNGARNGVMLFAGLPIRQSLLMPGQTHSRQMLAETNGNVLFLTLTSLTSARICILSVPGMSGPCMTKRPGNSAGASMHHADATRTTLNLSTVQIPEKGLLQLHTATVLYLCWTGSACALLYGPPCCSWVCRWTHTRGCLLPLPSEP